MYKFHTEFSSEISDDINSFSGIDTKVGIISVLKGNRNNIIQVLEFGDEKIAYNIVKRWPEQWIVNDVIRAGKESALITYQLLYYSLTNERISLAEKLIDLFINKAQYIRSNYIPFINSLHCLYFAGYKNPELIDKLINSEFFYRIGTSDDLSTTIYSKFKISIDDNLKYGFICSRYKLENQVIPVNIIQKVDKNTYKSILYTMIRYHIHRSDINCMKIPDDVKLLPLIDFDYYRDELQ